MSEKKHVLNFSEQAVIDSLYRFQEGLYPKDGELHDEHGNVIESGFLLRESIRPVPKMLLCASLWPKTSADKKTSVGLQGMEAALSVLQEHGLVREMTRPQMVYGAWRRVDGLIFESLETARAGEAKYRIRRANGEPILVTIEGATWTRGYELTSAGIDHVRNTQAAPTTAHATKNREVTITDAMSLCAAEGLAVPCKSDWTKYANLSPGEYGHLPTRKEGRNRYVTMNDARRFCRDHEARSAQRAETARIRVSSSKKSPK